MIKMVMMVMIKMVMVVKKVMIKMMMIEMVMIKMVMFFFFFLCMQVARHTRPEGHFKVWATIVLFQRP